MPPTSANLIDTHHSLQTIPVPKERKEILVQREGRLSDDIAEVERNIVEIEAPEINHKDLFAILEATRQKIENMGVALGFGAFELLSDVAGQEQHRAYYASVKDSIVQKTTRFHALARRFYELADKRKQDILPSIDGKGFQQELLSLFPVEAQRQEKPAETPSTTFRDPTGELPVFEVPREASSQVSPPRRSEYAQSARCALEQLTETERGWLLLYVISRSPEPMQDDKHSGVTDVRMRDVLELIESAAQKGNIVCDGEPGWKLQVAKEVLARLDEMRVGSRPNPYILRPGAVNLNGALPEIVDMPRGDDKEATLAPKTAQKNLKQWDDVQKQRQHVKAGSMSVLHVSGVQHPRPFDGVVHFYGKTGGKAEVIGTTEQVQVVVHDALQQKKPATLPEGASAPSELNAVRDSVDFVRAYDVGEIGGAIACLPKGGSVKLHIRSKSNTRVYIFSRDDAGWLDVQDGAGAYPVELPGDKKATIARMIEKPLDFFAVDEHLRFEVA